MAEELRLVDRDVLDSDAMFVAAHVDDAVDHDEGVAMRQQPQDVAYAGDAEGFGIHVPSPSALPPRRTRRRMTAALFSQSRAGWAGEPPQRSPLGISAATPLCAASMTPLPIVRWSAMPTCPPIMTKSPTFTLPDMPVCEAIRQCRPIETLCAICTRLSILVPSPMMVSRVEPRSIVVLAPISTSS